MVLKMKQKEFKQEIEQELEQFKKNLVLYYSLRPITINGHTENIKRMLKKLQTINPEKEEVTEYVYKLKMGGKSVSHISNNISSIEKYMEFKKKPIIYSKPRRIRQIIKDVLTEAEVSRMIQATKNIKEKAIITTLAYSGIRNKNLCELKLKDVDFGNNNLTIRKPKGKKEYVTNISSENTIILLKYLEKYPKKNDDYLFTTKVKSNKYSTSDIRKLVKVLAKRAKIEKNVYPHLLRHSLSSNMLYRGANIILIQKQMGHDWLQSTEIYLSIFPQRIKSEYEIYKPSYI